MLNTKTLYKDNINHQTSSSNVLQTLLRFFFRILDIKRHKSRWLKTEKLSKKGQFVTISFIYTVGQVFELMIKPMKRCKSKH